MALLNFKFYSKSLGMQTEVNVLMPQKNRFGEIGVNGVDSYEQEKYKCLYLLHGLSDDYSIWLRRTSIERYADSYGIAVVMPSAARSFYTDMKYGEKYYTYIAEELPSVIREFFNVSEKREDNFLAGLSMGGYGALKISLKNPSSFSAAAGFSSVTDINHWKNENLFKAIFGETDKAPDEEDLFYLVGKQSKNPRKPRIFMGIGTEDGLYEENIRLRHCFESGGYDFTFRESPGNHNWDFWDEYIRYALEWMLGKH